MTGAHLDRTHREGARRCICEDCIEGRRLARAERNAARGRATRAAAREEAPAIPTQRRRVAVGDRYGRLVVTGRAGAAVYSTSSHVLWECVCDCGATTVVRSPHLGRATRSCGCLKRETSTALALAGKGRRIVEVPLARSAHSRVAAARGRACEHPCVDCGEPAADWSYDWSDPDELPAPTGPYSLDITRYAPRCRRCHKHYDLAHQAAQEARS